ncbi:mechanosensitive ion channel family protein [Pseudanabaena minima]|uniref:mechanosensitive ion channel family protein n=1 Tax=Pseudanabaena minima TaxID=890415 RepID=UPI003DA94CE2
MSAITLSFLFATSQMAWGQSDILKLNWLTGQNIPNTQSIDYAVVRLDGYPLFVLAAPTLNQKVLLEQRVQDIENQLHLLANNNLDANNLSITIKIDPKNEQPVIAIQDRYLMTVTNIDAQIQGRDAKDWANQITQILRNALIKARQERQVPFLINQGLIAVGTLLAMIFGMRAISYLQRQLKLKQEQEVAGTEPEGDALQAANDPITELEQRLRQKLRANLSDLKRRALEICYFSIFGVCSFVVLGLFPYSRWIQSFLLSTPLKIAAIAFGTYLLVRISNLLIDRFAGFLKAREFEVLKSYQRLDLRVSTVSQVLRNVAAIALIGLGALAILSAVGVDLIPLLAGAGIVGIAISFAAQGLIKDVINGFLIILEDQYAVGDMIMVGELRGLVENMNLRVTQIRNNEGQFITIPNSSIAIVRNLSKDWARVDLAIRVTYDTNPDRALEILRNLAEEIYQENFWRDRIIELPEVLGIDDLQQSGMLIRIWIKTQPLQQLLVAREFRRRIKLRMEQEGITIGAL